MFRENEIGFESQMRRYRHLLSGDDARDVVWHQRAQLMQASTVQDALLELMTAAVALSERMAAGEPQTHLKFGVARRAKTLWLSLRGLLRLAPPDRTDPLPHEGVDEVARDLNVIYINVRGLLDNLAWAALHTAGSEQSRRAPNVRVGLFAPLIGNDEGLSDLANALLPYRAWHTELADRRDPAAHRIPLSVAPSVLSPEEAEEFQALNGKWQATLAEAVTDALERKIDSDAFDRAGAIFEQMGRIGQFFPWFHHHYSDGHYAIYPTVPEDLACMLKVAARTFEFLDPRVPQRQ